MDKASSSTPTTSVDASVPPAGTLPDDTQITHLLLKHYFIDANYYL